MTLEEFRKNEKNTKIYQHYQPNNTNKIIKQRLEQYNYTSVSQYVNESGILSSYQKELEEIQNTLTEYRSIGFCVLRDL